MIWATTAVRYKHNQEVKSSVFCLFPKRVDGHIVWLESIVRVKTWCDDGGGKGHWWTTGTSYHLTEAQKIRLGIKW